MSELSNTPVSTRRHFDVYTTSMTLKRPRTDFKTTSCAYWDGEFEIGYGGRLVAISFFSRSIN